MNLLMKLCSRILKRKMMVCFLSSRNFDPDHIYPQESRPFSIRFQAGCTIIKVHSSIGICITFNEHSLGLSFAAWKWSVGLGLYWTYRSNPNNYDREFAAPLSSTFKVGKSDSATLLAEGVLKLRNKVGNSKRYLPRGFPVRYPSNTCRELTSTISRLSSFARGRLLRDI